MPMGDSGGRSAGNRTGEGARRRNTPRERAQIDPPWDEAVPRYKQGQGTEVGPIFTIAARVSWIASCVLLAVVLCMWFGVI